MQDIEVQKVEIGTPAYKDLQKARDPLLVGIEEYQKAMVHDRDEISDLYLMVKDKMPIGTARICPSGDHLKVERVAIHQSWQGKGLGKILMQRVLENYNNSDKSIYVHAFTKVSDFYTKCGFKVEGYIEEDGFTLAKMKYHR